MMKILSEDSTITGTDFVDANRFRIAGTVYLGLAAIANILTGAVLLSVGTSDGMLQWAFVELQRYVTAQLLVQEGNTIATILTTGVTVAGLIVLVLGIVGLIVVVDAVRNRRYRRLLPASVASGLNPLAFPLASAAAVLFWLSR